MDSKRIERILSDSSPPGGADLPAGFAPAVVARAKQVKSVILRHRRWLIVSSLLAIAVAVAISIRAARKPRVIPPPIHAFEPPAFSTPGISHR